MRHSDIDLDTASRILTGPRGTATLQPKTSELLAYLMSHPERAVSKGELLKDLWSDAVVTEGSLTRAMSIMRKQLQEVGGDGFLAGLHTVRGFGYRLEGDTTASDATRRRSRVSLITDHSTDTHGAGLPASCLGREAEARRILTHVDAAIRRQQPRLVFLTGPPGIGKTFLLRALAAQLEDRNAKIAWGRAPESGPKPLCPWMEWVEQLRTMLPDIGVPESVDATFNPVEMTRDRASTVDASQVRVALLHDLVSYLRTCSERSPLVLILEDAQWCDATSLEVLRYAVDHLDPAPVTFIATYRDLELLPQSSQEEHLLQLRRSRVAQPAIRLEGLDDESVKALAERVSRKRVARRVARRIRRRTDGNPLFIEVLVRFHQDDSDDGSTFDPGRLVRWVPSGLPTLVRRRIEGLPDSTQALLAAGAVLGRSFSGKAVSQMTKRSVDQAAITIVLAEEEQLVVRFGEDRWRFKDQAVRDVVLTTLSQRKRSALHAAAAKMLERGVRGSATDNTLAELAYHYGEAGAAGSPERAIEYCARAGESSMERFAFEEAVDNFQRAVDTLDGFGPHDPRRKAQLLADLAEATFHAFGGERYTEAGWEAIRFARQQGLAELVGKTASRMSYRRIANIGVAPEERVRTLEWALERIGEDASELRAQILAALAFDLYWTGDFEHIRALNGQALQLARGAGALEIEFVVLKDRWGLFLHPDDTQTRREILEQAATIAEASGSISNRVFALGWKLADAIEAGDRKTFDATVVRLEALGGQAREPMCQSTLFAAKAMNAFLRGEFELAEELASEEHSFRVLGTSEATALPFHATFIYMLRLAQGKIGELEPLLVGGLSAYPQAVAFRLGLALCYAETDRNELARRALDEVLSSAESKLLRRDVNLHINLGLAAEVAACTGHAQAAERLLPLLKPFRGRQLTMEHIGVMGFADRLIGLIEATLNRPGDAEQSLRCAFELELGFGSVPGRAYIAMDLAEFLARRGASPDKVDPYIELARELVLNHDIRRLDARLKKTMLPQMTAKLNLV